MLTTIESIKFNQKLSYWTTREVLNNRSETLKINLDAHQQMNG